MVQPSELLRSAPDAPSPLPHLGAPGLSHQHQQATAQQQARQDPEGIGVKVRRANLVPNARTKPSPTAPGTTAVGSVFGDEGPWFRGL